MIALEAWAFDVGQILAAYLDSVSLGVCVCVCMCVCV
jgi:hypothetical protein